VASGELVRFNVTLFDVVVAALLLIENDQEVNISHSVGIVIANSVK